MMSPKFSLYISNILVFFICLNKAIDRVTAIVDNCTVKTFLKHKFKIAVLQLKRFDVLKLFHTYVVQHNQHNRNINSRLKAPGGKLFPQIRLK